MNRRFFEVGIHCEEGVAVKQANYTGSSTVVQQILKDHQLGLTLFLLIPEGLELEIGHEVDYGEGLLKVATIMHQKVSSSEWHSYYRIVDENFVVASDGLEDVLRDHAKLGFCFLGHSADTATEEDVMVPLSSYFK